MQRRAKAVTDRGGRGFGLGEGMRSGRERQRKEKTEGLERLQWLEFGKKMNSGRRVQNKIKERQ